MSSIYVCSELNRELLPDNEEWLVIGPMCWGRSRSLPVALHNAVTQLSYGGGQFTARVIPKGKLVMDDFNGNYRVEGWTKEQQERATVSTRVIAVTKTGTQRWGQQYKEDLKKHRKELSGVPQKEEANA